MNNGVAIVCIAIMCIILVALCDSIVAQMIIIAIISTGVIYALTGPTKHTRDVVTGGAEPDANSNANTDDIKRFVSMYTIYYKHPDVCMYSDTKYRQKKKNNDILIIHMNRDDAEYYMDTGLLTEWDDSYHVRNEILEMVYTGCKYNGLSADINCIAIGITHNHKATSTEASQERSPPQHSATHPLSATTLSPTQTPTNIHTNYKYVTKLQDYIRYCYNDQSQCTVTACLYYAPDQTVNTSKIKYTLTDPTTVANKGVYVHTCDESVITSYISKLITESSKASCIILKLNPTSAAYSLSKLQETMNNTPVSHYIGTGCATAEPDDYSDANPDVFVFSSENTDNAGDTTLTGVMVVIIGNKNLTIHDFLADDAYNNYMHNADYGLCGAYKTLKNSIIPSSDASPKLLSAEHNSSTLPAEPTDLIKVYCLVDDVMPGKPTVPNVLTGGYRYNTIINTTSPQPIQKKQPASSKQSPVVSAQSPPAPKLAAAQSPPAPKPVPAAIVPKKAAPKKAAPVSVPKKAAPKKAAQHASQTNPKVRPTLQSPVLLHTASSTTTSRSAKTK